jgi:hypothetical protein
MQKNIVRASYYNPSHRNKSKVRRVTSEYGSMAASDLWERQGAMRNADEAAANTRMKKQADLRELYDKCKDSCTCEGDTCKARGFFLCMTCDPCTVKKQICGVKKCIEARAKPGAVYVTPLPGKPGQSRKRKAGENQTRNRNEDETDSDFELGNADADSDSDSEASDGINEADSESDSDDSDDSDDSALVFANVARSIHKKSYNWQNGAFYRVFWSDQGKWLIGQYDTDGKNPFKTGVELYYEADDTVATHLYRDKWHILPHCIAGRAN